MLRPSASTRSTTCSTEIPAAVRLEAAARAARRPSARWRSWPELRAPGRRNTPGAAARLASRRRLLRPLHARRSSTTWCVAAGVLHRLHAVPARGQPGHAAGHLRVPVDDLRAHRHGRRQRLDVRRRDRVRRGRAHGRARHDARASVVVAGTRAPRVRAVVLDDVRRRRARSRPWSTLPGATTGRRRGRARRESATTTRRPSLVAAPELPRASRGPRGARRGRARGRRAARRRRQPGPRRACSSRRRRFGADIVVGEGQPLGNADELRRPGPGLFACREAHLRQMPGPHRRPDRRRATGAARFVLTLQTREQHIRREKATSNICSNHALNALAAAVYLSPAGAAGPAGTSRAPASRKAHYLRERLLATGRFDAPSRTRPFGHEFALRLRTATPRTMHARDARARASSPGVDLGAPSTRELAGLVLFARDREAHAGGDRRVRGGGGVAVTDAHRRSARSRATAPPAVRARSSSRRGSPGRRCVEPARLDVPAVAARSPCSGGGARRTTPPRCRTSPSSRSSRHYPHLATMNFGVDIGHLPARLLHDEVQPARQRGRLPARRASPACTRTSRQSTAQGALELHGRARSDALAEISGLPGVTLQPAAGAHGELTALHGLPRLPRAPRRRAHERSSSPTPRTARTRRPSRCAATRSTTIPSDARGGVDLDALQAALDTDVAALMLTNPNTLGLFDAQHRRDHRGRCTRPARSPTATARTSTRSSARRARATWASTPCTSTCTRRSRRRTAAAARAPGPVVRHRGRSRRSCPARCPSAARTARFGLELRPAAVDRPGAHASTATSACSCAPTPTSARSAATA